MNGDEEKRRRYRSLAHAIQTGIAWDLAIHNPNVEDINADPNLREHKHLRTGIDITKAENGALVRLLIAKGIFTMDEYEDAIIDGLEREVALYETRISELLGWKIKLG